MQGNGRRNWTIHIGDAQVNQINIPTKRILGEEYSTETPTLPSPPIVNSILRHKRKYKPDNKGTAYAISIHDDSINTDDNNNDISGFEIAPMPDNNFRHDLNNDHSINNETAITLLADGDIDLILKLRKNHHNSDTRGDCLDYFITYHVAPEYKIRPTYEDCLMVIWRVLHSSWVLR